MKELDNFKIRDLDLLLNEDTTLKRYYPLIPLKNKLIKGLIDAGIQNKYDCLETANEELIEKGLNAIVNDFDTDLEDVKKLLCLCDLMRLPGVKNIRVELYFNCGLKTINDFTKFNADTMRSNIENIIVKKKLSCSVPLLKELKTQIAVAKVLPKVI